MNYLFVVGAIATVLFTVYRMIQRARVDDTLTELNLKERREAREHLLKEIARAEKEIEDAKIDYKRIRDGKPAQSPSPGSDV